MNKISLLGPRVLIKPDKQPNVTKSGIIVAAEEKKPVKGEVVAVGDTRTLQEGDTVIFHEHALEQLKIDDVTYLIGDEEDIACRLT